MLIYWDVGENLSTKGDVSALLKLMLLDRLKYIGPVLHDLAIVSSPDLSHQRRSQIVETS